MMFRIPAIAKVFVLAGCVGMPCGVRLTWSELTEVADVTFGAPTFDGETVSIPIHVEQPPESPLHDLHFGSRFDGEAILVTAYRQLPEHVEGERDRLIVQIPEPMRSRYDVVWADPDGTSRVIHRISLHDSAGDKVSSSH